MFKEVKRAGTNSNQIKSQIELHLITSGTKIDRTESCFAGKSRQTKQQYHDGAKRAAKLASKWF